MATSAAHVTFAQFEALPDRPGKTELLDGEVLHLPPADAVHGRFVVRIYKALSKLSVECEGNDERVYPEMGYRMGPNRANWLQPDVSVQYLGQEEHTYLEGAPMLAVEVASKSNTPRRLARKCALYLEQGAREVWVVYTEKRILVQHLADGAVREHAAAFATGIVGGRAFPLDTIWL